MVSGKICVLQVLFVLSRIVLHDTYMIMNDSIGVEKLTVQGWKGSTLIQ